MIERTFLSLSEYRSVEQWRTTKSCGSKASSERRDDDEVDDGALAFGLATQHTRSRSCQ